jgi:hypothetical protein
MRIMKRNAIFPIREFVLIKSAPYFAISLTPPGVEKLNLLTAVDILDDGLAESHDMVVVIV